MLNEVLAEFVLVAGLEVVAEFEPSESTLIGDEHKTTRTLQTLESSSAEITVLMYWHLVRPTVFVPQTPLN